MNNLTTPTASGTGEPTNVSNDISVSYADHITNDFGNVGSSAVAGEMKVVTKHSVRNLDGSLKDSIEMGDETSLKQFLARPLEVLVGSFATTDSASTFSNRTLFRSILSNNIYKNKLAGYYAIRADVVLTLHINGNPFQQGRYILGYCPTGGCSNSSYTFAHRTTLTQITQLPHVEVDIACDSEGQLKIPYQSFNLATLVSDATNVAIRYSEDPGFWFLYPYSPLVAPSGSTTVGFTVFAHFENVELFGAAAPQSGYQRKVKKKNPSEVELESQGKKPISSALNAVSDASQALSKIPMLSTYATPVSWISSALARTAASFGWSKPTDPTAPNKMIAQAFHGMSNVDVVDTGISLGVSSGNMVETPPGFAGTDVDEMSIDYIKGIYAYVNNTSWSTSDVNGGVILDLPTNPCEMYRSSVIGVTTVYSMAPICYLAQLFRYWRGSFKFKFKLVKTPYHSGRLEILWLPFNTYVNNATPAINDENAAYVMRKIVDIRDGNEFEFLVPFVNNQPWKLTKSGNDGATGDLVVRILDPLRAPSTVSSTISILVEVCGGEDFEYAIPEGTGINVLTTNQFQSGYQRNPCKVGNDDKEESIVNDDASIIPSAMTIGERVVSLRALVKKYSQCGPFGGYEFTNSNLTMAPTFPWGYHDGTTLTPPSNTQDLMTLIGAMYGLWRGSVRYKVFSTNGQPDMFLAAIDTENLFGSPRPAATSASTVSTVGASLVIDNQQIFMGGLTGGVEITTPYYSMTHSTPMLASVTNASSFPFTGGNYDNPYARLPTLYVGAVPTKNLAVYRAAGEDFSFGLFISTPLVYGTLH